MSDTTPRPTVPEQPVPVEQPAAVEATPRAAEPVELAAPSAAQPAEPLITASEPPPLAESAAAFADPAAAPSAEAGAHPAAEPAASAPEPSPYPQPIYMSAPVPPLPRGNRGFGVLIVLLGAIFFVLLDVAAVYGALALLYSRHSGEVFLESYLQSWSFWLPFAVFILAFLALVSIVNRGGWWAYVLGSLFVAALVFAGFIAAALLTEYARISSVADATAFLHGKLQPNVPYAWVTFLGSLVALEVVTWAGLWISVRGAAVKRRNAEARAAFDLHFGAIPDRIV